MVLLPRFEFFATVSTIFIPCTQAGRRSISRRLHQIKNPAPSERSRVLYSCLDNIYRSKIIFLDSVVLPAVRR